MNSALEALADERIAEAFPLQHELLGLPDGSALEAAVKRKAGRPPGARNRRVEDAARYVVEHLGDPLVQLAAIATAPIDELMAIGLTAQQAIVEKRLALVGLLPYTHQRKAIELEVTTRQGVYLTIVDAVVDPQQDQGVSDAIVVQLDSPEFDDAPKPLIGRAFPPVEQLIADQAQPAPAEAPHPPGGGGFPAPRPHHAPACVVPPRPRIFSREPQGPRPTGLGSGA
ncbi:MAG: hypothetical protein ACKVQR_04470 [Aquabacterium sp.]